MNYEEASALNYLLRGEGGKANDVLNERAASLRVGRTECIMMHGDPRTWCVSPGDEECESCT